MIAPSINIRPAVEDDLPEIVRMLADDPLGSQRERSVDPLPGSYYAAFEAIEQDSNNELVVAEAESGAIIAVLQLTFTPYITYQGGWRATIEGVRVDRQPGLARRDGDRLCLGAGITIRVTRMSFTPLRSVKPPVRSALCSNKPKPLLSLT